MPEFNRTTLQIKSSITGVWDISVVPTGEWCATHEEFDGAEDSGDDRVVYAGTAVELIEAVREYGEG